jgi:selenocysteine-specific elongation factor
LVEKDIRQRIDATSLAGAPIVRVSSRDGRGLDELKEAIGQLAAETATRRDFGKPRLPVDRVFTMKGSGVVVTGTLSGGPLSNGDDVVISPADLPAHLRSVESYKQKAATALPGSRVALNLAGVKKEDIARGDIILARGQQTLATGLIDVEIRLLTGLDRPVKNNSELVVFLETRELLGRVVLLDAKALPPGGSALAQLRLNEDVATYIGQRFVVRSQSPAQTIGGGVVLDPLARKHRLKDSVAVTAFLKKRAKSGLEGLLLSEVEKYSHVESKELLKASVYSAVEIAACLDELEKGGKLIVAGAYIVDSGYFGRQDGVMLEVLKKEHSINPLRPGLSQAELASRLGMPREVFSRLLAQASAEGKIVVWGESVALAGHRARLSPEQEKLAERVRALFAKSGSNPPTRKELASQLTGAADIIGYMCRQGMLAELPDGILLPAETYEAARKAIVTFLEKNGQISIQDVNTLLGFSRKYSIPLLTRLDQEGFTRRQENVRVLARKRP